jgi:hypothetical protein
MKHLNNYELIELDRTKSVSSLEKKVDWNLKMFFLIVKVKLSTRIQSCSKSNNHITNFGVVNENIKQTLKACA